MYFPTLSSMFKIEEYERKVINKLELLQDDIDMLIKWNNCYVDECNNFVIENEKEKEYNKDYLELQRLVNKILKIKED